MTLTTLITANAILGAAALYGLILLLTHGIRSDLAHVEAEIHSLTHRTAERLAA